MQHAYRTDIDGMRAVAIAAVVLHHAAAPGFQGEYIGVDIFFVISSYLITLLLIGSLNRRRAGDWPSFTCVVLGGSCRHCASFRSCIDNHARIDLPH